MKNLQIKKRLTAPVCHPPADLLGAPRVVIIGGGFAGINALNALKGVKAEIIVIDKRNYHLFQPLLYQVATAALNPSQIAVPLRKAVEIQDNCTVYLSEVMKVDPDRSTVFLGESQVPLAYDYLVVATGVETNYFGHPEWSSIAPGLKTVDEALGIRRRFLLAFEQAEVTHDDSLRSELLTFVIVGAGPTGVELAGAMAEIAQTTLTCSFRRFNSASARIIVVDSGDRILKSFSPENSRSAQEQLEELGVEIILNARVVGASPTEVVLSMKDGTTNTIKTRQLVWAAGVKGTRLGSDLKATPATGGRVPVEPDLSVPGYPNIFVAGDLALSSSADTGAPVPGVAQGAIQMGKYVGERIAAKIRSGSAGMNSIPAKPFSYFDKGSMATIGRGRAVVQMKGLNLRGLTAWIAWAAIHVLFLSGFRNRVGIFIQWVWMFITYERGVRLITGADDLVAKIEMPTDKRRLSGKTPDLAVTTGVTPTATGEPQHGHGLNP